MKLKSAVQKIAADFAGNNFARPRLEAENLICSLFSWPRSDLYLHAENSLSESDWQKCLTVLQRRISGEPLAYIIGEVEFYGANLNITSDVLIPRPETEILTDLVSSSLVKLPSKTSVKALDLCSGSGAIAIALKKKHPWLQVCAGDISAQALAVARLNGQKNAVQIDFREGDLLTPFDDCKFDLVVCNPPYISKPVYDALSFEVKDFEPREALLGGETGLEFYLKLEQQLPRFLNENAVIWFEIGYDQGEALMSIFRALNGWKSCRLIKDFAGHDRFFTCSN